MSGAERYFEAAVKAAPEYTQAWVSLAGTLGMKSRVPEAKAALARALALDPNNADALQLSQALRGAQSER